MRRLALAALLLLPLAIGGCKKGAEARTFQGHGVVEGFQADGKVIILKHDKIEGLMEGMTMGFELKDPAAAKALKVGDAVDFSLAVTADNLLVTQVSAAKK